ncbi:uncharacterized protein LOC107966049 isoform X2 [Apis mellifera]|uniref:Uncharacterized protein LOC107966049 isoform X2 n=1 Tax=Apis mellifera TaxID=7460 RepID=A0A7M7IL67_APIME|nr:uncharacterized protein LOC107966049 isoform X2 [Apis mellifera]|eukprot:XP_016773341.1 uncharacterized protein LOC107966049 isoform X2 [Apis mellifera]
MKNLTTEVSPGFTRLELPRPHQSVHQTRGTPGVSGLQPNERRKQVFEHHWPPHFHIIYDVPEGGLMKEVVIAVEKGKRRRGIGRAYQLTFTLNNFLQAYYYTLFFLFPLFFFLFFFFFFCSFSPLKQ